MTIESTGASLLVRGAHHPERGRAADILVRDGRIERVDSHIDAPEVRVLDATGHVVLPGLVDAHCHVDKTLWGRPWLPHGAPPTIRGRIRHEREVRAARSLPSREAIRSLMGQQVARGTTAIRTHTNVDSGVGLAGVELVSEVAVELGAELTVQQVAFPQSGILADPGTAGLLAEAGSLGVTAIGGLDPAGLDGDPKRHLDLVFDLAERSDLDVDVHLHDGGELGLWQVGLIADRARALGMQGRVAIGHAFGLWEVPETLRSPMLGRLAEAGVALVTAVPLDRPVPALDEATAAGVVVACGSDGIRDPWTPYGNGDMLERAMLLAMRCGLRRDDGIERAVAAATYAGARVLRLPDYGLEPGSWADLVLVPGAGVAEATVSRPPERVVVKRGVVVAGG